MKFTYFHLMPYAYLPEDFEERFASPSLTFPNGYFDPARGVELYHRYLDELEYADQLGFDGIAVNEHHQSAYGLMPSPNIMAAALARRTSNAKLMVLGNAIGIREDPLRVAEEIAMLDAMSDGRVIVLLLRGLAFEHNTYVPVGDKSREMTQEGIELVLKAWTEPKPFAWNGKHYRFQSISVWPRTKQVPHPPMFGSGNSEESALFAARHRFGLAMSFMPVSRIKRMVAVYKAEAQRCGWSPGPEQILYRGICLMGADDDDNNLFERAEAEARASGADAPLIVHGPFFTGGPRSILRQIASLRDSGVGVIDLDIVASNDAVNYVEQSAALERFGSEVLPEIRNW